MHFARLLPASLSLILAAGAVARSAEPGAHIEACEGEEQGLHCYNGKDDIPQNVLVEDVAAVAKALRDYGREIDGGRLLTMTIENAPGCAEWEIFRYRSVLALAKHVDPKANSSVLYEDIARTIDGGPSTSANDDDVDVDKKKKKKKGKKGIISCSTSGGAQGVLVNKAASAYHTNEYKKLGFTPNGILIKIVSNIGKLDL
ncbi:hypothetical protein HIM_03263 [Hirsutella minnesotensis 3608]|nr:hypothetical protein HIM_03263 [Hirsutella minnesotensis 3608]